MLRGGEVKELQELKRQGLSITQISLLTGFDRKTIRKYLQEDKTPCYGPRAKRASKLEPFEPYLQLFSAFPSASVQRTGMGITWAATLLSLLGEPRTLGRRNLVIS